MIRFQVGAWVGLDTLGPEELEKLRPKAELGVERAARYLVNAIKRLLTGPRTGRVYPVGRRGRVHQASAPGEPPATLTGKLRQSIAQSDPIWDGWSVTVDVGSALPYSRRLEWGGVDRRGVRILPRPYFAPAALASEPEIERILERTI